MFIIVPSSELVANGIRHTRYIVYSINRFTAYFKLWLAKITIYRRIRRMNCGPSRHKNCLHADPAEVSVDLVSRAE